MDYSTTNRGGNCTHDGTTKFGLTYSYGSSGSNNGQITGITDSVDNGRSATYSYDALYRLLTAATTGSTGYPAWGPQWTYDRYGNALSEAQTVGAPPSYSVTVAAASNHITGSPFAYDANGNMTYDGNHSYTYDAENRLIQVGGGSTASYVYDAVGHRVTKTVSGAWRHYLYDTSGNVVAENLSAGWNVGYAYLGGQLLAQYSNGTTYFVHPDHLGSTRLRTSLNQSVYDSFDYLPFGELLSGAGDYVHKFTGDDRDDETGLDHTWFRQYSSSLGRWMHPDPAGLAAVDPANPQSWNRYAYASNDPIDYVDLSGRRECLAVGLGGCDATSAGSGGGGLSYIVDGIEMPSSMNGFFGHMLSIGAGFSQCPNNTCAFQSSTGQFVRYVAFVNGGNFYAYYGPGALYYSADAAGKAALNYIKDQGGMSPYWDYETNQLGAEEWGTKIYEDQNGIFSFAEPIQGPFCADGSAFCTINVRSVSIPDGSVLAGIAHTHSDWWVYNPGGFSAEDFYSAEHAFGSPIPSYLLTLEGTIAVFDLSLPAPHVFVFSGPPLIH